MKKRAFWISALAFVVLLGLVASGTVVMAENSLNNYPPVVQRLAQRFKLQPAEVNKVFLEVRQERDRQRQVWFEDRLEAAVKEGKITEAQKDAFLKKRAEIQKEMDEVRNSNLTPQEKWEKLSKLREEMRSWAEQNKISLSLCPGGPQSGAGYGKAGKFKGQCFRGNGLGPGSGNCAGSCFRQ